MVAAIQVAGSFMAVLSFGLVLEMPRKYLERFLRQILPCFMP